MSQIPSDHINDYLQNIMLYGTVMFHEVQCPWCQRKWVVMQDPVTKKADAEIDCHCGCTFPVRGGQLVNYSILSRQESCDWIGIPTNAEIAEAQAMMPGRATGHLLAWRVWGFDKANGLIQSFNDIPWFPGEPMVAKEASSIPVAQGHGIYALHSVRHSGLWDYLWLALRESWDRFVIGEVALWGKIVEHRRGYRAQFAYPTRFVLGKWIQGPCDYPIKHRLEAGSMEDIQCRNEHLACPVAEKYGAKLITIDEAMRS